MKTKAGLRYRGITLIELMIAVVVVAILAAVAIPNYIEYVRRGSRVEAKAALLEAAARMQQHYTLNNSYSAEPPPVFSKNSKYAISISKKTDTTYRLQAVPPYADKCGTFTIDQSGERSLGLGTHTSTVDECWAQ